MLDLDKIRSDFPMLRNHIQMQGKPLVWLDNASTTFKPDCVINETVRYYSFETANSHRGDYDLCYNMDQKVLGTRKAVALLLHCDPTEVVFTAGDTAGMNLIAYGYAARKLGPDDEILITQAEHASNVLPWYRVAELTGCQVNFIPLTKEGRLTVENLKKVISPKTKIVSIAGVTNVLGYLAPMKELAEVAHENGAIFILDGAQCVPHMKMDVQDLDCDFLAFSSHKMCGPTGVGVLYGKYDLLKQTQPYMTGGGMNVKFDMCGEASFLEPPMRFEAGTQPLAEICALRPAVEYLESIGLDNIQKHERELKKYAVEELQKTGKVTIYNPDSEAGIVTFNINGVFAQDAATYLNSRGIACRSGNHCAKILSSLLGTVATVRASFYLYTTKQEIDALVDAVKNGGHFLDAYFN